MQASPPSGGAVTEWALIYIPASTIADDNEKDMNKKCLISYH